jgi:peptidoglycan/LPS O-acetylase OafA/YrhL
VLPSAATPRAIVSVICSWYSIVGDSAPICYTQARTRSIVMSDAAVIRACSTTEIVDHPGSRRRSARVRVRVPPWSRRQLTRRW